MRSSEEYKRISVEEFSKVAENYENDKAGIYKYCRKDYPEILAEIEKEPFETLLDAGCGTGPMLTLLTNRFPEKRFIGIDLTPKMIEVARKKGLPNAEFVVGDCENLPFEDNAFDVIICSQSFHHYPDPQSFFHSVYRCLKPQGKLVLIDCTSNNPFVQFFMRKIQMPIANRLGHGDVNVYIRREIQQFCSNAKLRIERYEVRPFFRMHCVARKI